MRLVFAWLVFAPVLAAQTPASPPTEAAVSGMVRDKGTGKPLANYAVTTWTNATWVGNMIAQSRSTKQVESRTDESGHYRLPGLPSGNYRIIARDAKNPGFNRMERNIALAGQDLEDINFDIDVPGTIRGRVLDENKEPVPEMQVSLVERQYYMGRLIYVFKGAGRTNDRGEYSVKGLEAGRPYLLLAEEVPSRLQAHSEVPLNPKLRRPTPMRTWYPNSPDVAGAAEIAVRSGEIREGVDIDVRKSPSRCVEGVMTLAGAPAALNFQIEAQSPSSGLSASGGTVRGGPGGKTGADGQFRICDLYPGTYRLDATNAFDALGVQDFAYGADMLSIGDQDVKDVKVIALSGSPVGGEIVLDGPAPTTPLDAKVSVSLDPLLRGNYHQELDQRYKRADIPGSFSLPSIITDDYAVRTFVNSPGLYIKDVTYGGVSVMNAPLRLGSLSAGTLRVTIGQDGGKISARVTGRDSAPVPDMNIVIVPVENASEAAIAANLVTGKTDQNGQYTSQTLAPGKYYVVATDEEFDASVASIARLWASHTKFTEVDLAPNGQAQVALQPAEIGR